MHLRIYVFTGMYIQIQPHFWYFICLRSYFGNNCIFIFLPTIFRWKELSNGDATCEKYLNNVKYKDKLTIAHYNWLLNQKFYEGDQTRAQVPHSKRQANSFEEFQKRTASHRPHPDLCKKITLWHPFLKTTHKGRHEPNCDHKSSRQRFKTLWWKPQKIVCYSLLRAADYELISVFPRYSEQAHQYKQGPARWHIHSQAF